MTGPEPGDRARGDLTGFTIITEADWQEYRSLLRMRAALKRICARNQRTVGTAALRRLIEPKEPK